MKFYNDLQLDPFVIKQKIHQSDSAKARKRLMLVLFVRSILIVAFAILFISVINAIFGAENSYLAVVLFCMLLSLRFVHFGYKITQAIISLAVILGILFLIPVVFQINNVLIKTVLNFLMLGIILLLTGNKPQMGNPGLYSFSYVFLTGTSIRLNSVQLASRGILLIIFFGLFSLLYVLKHEKKNISQSFNNILLENGLLSKKNLWLLYYAFGISLILGLGYLTNIRRYMWVGIAFSSMISIYELSNVRERFADRIIGVIAGSILFLVLVQVVPANILGTLGGISLGLCTTYRFKNIFNCFGALALATTLFGSTSAMVLRIANNFMGLVLGCLYLILGRYVYQKINDRKLNKNSSPR